MKCDPLAFVQLVRQQCPLLCNDDVFVLPCYCICTTIKYIVWPLSITVTTGSKASSILISPLHALAIRPSFPDVFPSGNFDFRMWKMILSLKSTNIQRLM